VKRAPSLEREVKLRFKSAEEARAAVERAGATPLRGRRLQEDCLLDNANEDLRARCCALRVRSEGGKSRLTFKGPVQPSSMKLREEHETVAGDADVLLRILDELGYAPWFRYQKYREEFTLEDVIVAVDETPVGTFVELEGSESGITKVATLLERTPSDYVLDSYRTLFVAWERAQGKSGGNMVFEEP
jgi:adenylate cyclase class 2